MFREKYVALLSIIIVLTATGLLISTGVNTSLASQNNNVTVLIVYYSHSGHTEKMAYAVAEGVRRVEEVRATVKKVTGVTKEDLRAANGLILGSPTYYANMAAPMKQFIDDWYFEKVDLFDKVGGAFSTGGGMTAGRETVINSLLLAMLNNGMIVVGPLYESWGTFGSSAITARPDTGISDYELDDARRLGERVARVVLKLQQGGKS